MGNGTSVNRRKTGRPLGRPAAQTRYNREVDFAELGGRATGSMVKRPNRWMAFNRGASILPLQGERQEKEAPKSSAPRRPIRLGIDVPLLLVVCTIVIFGLLMVFSASWEYSIAAGDPPTGIFVRQLMFVAAGTLVAVFLAWVDYRRWQRFIVFAMIGTIIALGITLMVGESRHGAVRTLFGGSVQPSEMAKLVVVMYLAVWLHAKRDQLKNVSFGLLPLIIMLGAFSGLIFLQPDMSAAITIVLLGASLFFLAGGDMKQIILLVVGVAIVGTAVVYFTSTGSDRWGSFVPGLKNPLDASYHVRRSFEAFVKGGWFGVGIGKADTKLTGLPVPHTDSIFAVIGEETGVFGSVVMVLLYALVLWRGLKIARQAPDGLGTLLAAGLSIWLVLEAFINMAVMVGLMPFAGNALPFVSAGGSSLLVSLAAVGLLFSIARMSEKSKEEEERSFSAIVDMRRRDWRGREPRTRRSAGSSKGAHRG